MSTLSFGHPPLSLALSSRRGNRTFVKPFIYVLTSILYIKWLTDVLFKLKLDFSPSNPRLFNV
jgi:hypothetical protein